MAVQWQPILSILSPVKGSQLEVHEWCRTPGIPLLDAVFRRAEVCSEVVSCPQLSRPSGCNLHFRHSKKIWVRDYISPQMNKGEGNCDATSLGVLRDNLILSEMIM